MAEEILNDGLDLPDVPRLRLGQQSHTGLRVIGGRIFEEEEIALQWPNAIHTYKRMMKDATIAPAVAIVETAIARVPWEIKCPEGKEEQLKDKAEFLRQVMNDMEHPWGEFVRQISTHNSYGFAVSEKVYRYRKYDKGSKYNDGRVGLRKLTPIPQDTIANWEFSEDGKSLKGLWQTPAMVSNRGRGTISQTTFTNEPTYIQRKKFLLFRNNSTKGNPEGISPLNGCYRAWRYKVSMEEFEATSVSQDMRGLKVLYLPPNYMAPDADPSDKEVYEYYKEGMSKLHRNEQSALILPMFRDDNGNKMFEFDAVSVTGQKAHDIDAIINRYKKEVITALMAGQLILGQEGGGSYSLAQSLDSVTQMVIDARLTEIKEQLNHDLIPQLFQLNGWDITEVPYFDFGEIARESLDELSKYIQRCAAAGLLPKTPRMVNFITSRLGLEAEFIEGQDSEAEFESKLTGFESNAGEGMAPGTTGNGTARSSSTRDNSVANNAN